MSRLELRVRACTSCGIFMDLCPTGAIGMRTTPSRRVEGPVLLIDVWGESREHLRAMTFPYLAHSHQCDGCLRCVRECPARAMSWHAGP